MNQLSYWIELNHKFQWFLWEFERCGGGSRVVRSNAELPICHFRIDFRRFLGCQSWRFFDRVVKATDGVFTEPSWKAARGEFIGQQMENDYLLFQRKRVVILSSAAAFDPCPSPSLTAAAAAAAIFIIFIINFYHVRVVAFSNSSNQLRNFGIGCNWI